MPHLNSHRVQHRLAELGLTVKELAERCEIGYGTLRNAVYGHDATNLHRAYRVLDALNPPGRALLSINDILDEQKPADPPKQPSGPKGPPKRQDHEPGKTAPKRVKDGATA